MVYTCVDSVRWLMWCARTSASNLTTYRTCQPQHANTSMVDVNGNQSDTKWLLTDAILRSYGLQANNEDHNTIPTGLWLSAGQREWIDKVNYWGYYVTLRDDRNYPLKDSV